MATALNIVEWLSASLGDLKMRCNLHPQASARNHYRGKAISWRIVVIGALAIILLLTACSSGIGGTDPAWSPDGTKIAFESRLGGSTLDICVMNADGSNQTKLTNSAAEDFQPAWSPDGSKIAFESFQPETKNGDIWVMNADGSNQINLTNSRAQEGGPAWSPDGSKIAFNWNPGYHDDIWVMKADGSNKTKLTES